MKQTSDQRFLRLLRKLPPAIQKRVALALILFEHEPTPTGLDFKKINTRTGAYYRIKITAGYRAVGVLEDDIITWFWVGTHADYDLLLKSL